MTVVPLHLLRHGAPETPGLLMGRTDGAPTAAGIDVCLAQVAGLEIERIVSSDLQRAHHAAQAIGARLGRPVSIDRRWRELDFGLWDGLAPAAVDADALARFWRDPDGHAPPQGERWSALVARVGDAIADLPDVPVLVLTHGGAMRAALAHLCGFSVEQAWRFALPYAALLSLQCWAGEQPCAQISGLRA